MKRALNAFLLAAALTMSVAVAQEEHAAPSTKGEAAHPDMMVWKWANFAILVIGLGYMASKMLPPFFRSRDEEIQSGIAEAAKMKAEAEARSADIDRRLANLGDEIEKLRAGLKEEVAAEGQRIKDETARLAKRLQEQAEQEIQFMTKAARQELKAYSANRALELAKQRIDGHVTADTQHSLVQSFVHDLQAAGDRSGAAQ